MADRVIQVKLTRGDNQSFGISLLGQQQGLPPIIYNIDQNSPAALCSQIEIGDVLLKINDIDCNRFSTKQVLKCLRLSSDPITLKLKKDVSIKEKIHRYHHQVGSLNLDDDIIDNSSLSTNSSSNNASSKFNLINHQIDIFKNSDLNNCDQQLITNNSDQNIRTNGDKNSDERSDQQLNNDQILTINQRSNNNHNTTSRQTHCSFDDKQNINCRQNNSDQLLDDCTGLRPTWTNQCSQSLLRMKNMNRNKLKQNHIGGNNQTSNNTSSECSDQKMVSGDSNKMVANNSTTTTSDNKQLTDNDYFMEVDRQQWEPMGPLAHEKLLKKKPQTSSPTNVTPTPQPRFEAFMMTGDLILKLSPMAQNNDLLQTNPFFQQKKKVDMLRMRNNKNYSNSDQVDSSNGSSSSNSCGYSDRLHNNNNNNNKCLSGDQVINSFSDLKISQNNSVPSSPSEVNQTCRCRDYYYYNETTSGTNSAGASPLVIKRNLQTSSVFNTARCCINCRNDMLVTNSHHVPGNSTTGGGVRTSRSEDHLQFQNDVSPDETKLDGNSLSVNIDDEDVTSSLNTLLDTRNDDELVANNSVKTRNNIQNATEKSPESASQNGSSSDKLLSHHYHHSKNGSDKPISNNNSVETSSDLKCCVSQNGREKISVSDGGNNVSPLVCSSKSDRIVWTYNAPVTQMITSSIISEPSPNCFYTNGMLNNVGVAGNGSSTSSGSLRSESPVSPTTSVSSSIMSSSGQRGLGAGGMNTSVTSTSSAREASETSPEYHDNDSSEILRLDSFMISDPSDSDSTILASERTQVRRGRKVEPIDQHKIVIQVKGPNDDIKRGHTTSNEYNEVVERLGEDDERYKDKTNERSGDVGNGGGNNDMTDVGNGEDDDESDLDSLHSFHYSPKGVDIPSAIRLAKRLYFLDGFKKSDVSRHLSKNNDFSRAVAEEYLKYFNFDEDSLDVALRKFLKQFSLTGETQERERVLIHFSKRYLDCNPGSFHSQDAVHTLTCAIMLLNTDLHGQNIGRKMTCTEFIENLAELNDGQNFPREILKQLYHAIKNFPLQWALDDDFDGFNLDKESTTTMNQQQQLINNNNQQLVGGNNHFQFDDQQSNYIEYKKGYVMRKCCFDANRKKTPFGKRGWKMYYCTLRDMVLYLHKDENGFRKSQMSDMEHNAIRIHHALATRAGDYTKKQHVFRLQTADQSEYLFQASNSKELQSWIDTINYVAACFSAPPLEGGVGSQKRFQRPLLPCSQTKLNLRLQLFDHEDRVKRLENELEQHRLNHPEKGAKHLHIHYYKDKEAYLQYEVCRYKTYAYLLRSRLMQYNDSNSMCGGGSSGGTSSAITSVSSSSQPPSASSAAGACYTNLAMDNAIGECDEASATTALLLSPSRTHPIGYELMPPRQSPLNRRKR